MINSSSRRKRCSAGFSIVEVLIALLLTGILATVTFRFYVSMHQVHLTQQEISDMQQNCRACLQEITRALRLAGFKLPAGTRPFEIRNDTLMVYYSQTQPVDTVMYYVEEYSDHEYAKLKGLPKENRFTYYKLMKKENGGYPEMFAENLTGIRFSQLAPSVIEVEISVQATKTDETFTTNAGFRTYRNSEQINLRNLNL